MHIKEHAHEHTGSAETLRPSLRSGFTAYFVLSPAIGLFCHRRPQEALAPRELDASVEASGPHDFTVRIGTIRQLRRPRPPQPVPTSVTTADAPHAGQDGRNTPVICGPEITRAALREDAILENDNAVGGGEGAHCGSRWKLAANCVRAGEHDLFANPSVGHADDLRAQNAMAALRSMNANRRSLFPRKRCGIGHRWRLAWFARSRWFLFRSGSYGREIWRDWSAGLRRLWGKHAWQDETSRSTCRRLI